MELELVEKGEDSILVKIDGEDHTFSNLLRGELSKDDNVASAIYTIGHPITEPVKIYVKVKNKSPERAIIDAAGRVAKQLEDLQKQLRKELKK